MQGANKNSQKTHLYSQIVGFAALTLFMLAKLVYCPNKDIPPVSAREDFYLLITSRLENVQTNQIKLILFIQLKQRPKTLAESKLCKANY